MYDSVYVIGREDHLNQWRAYELRPKVLRMAYVAISLHFSYGVTWFQIKGNVLKVNNYYCKYCIKITMDLFKK